MADKHGWIVMLHIPRSGRLKDKVNLAQLMEIEEKYPNVKLVVAHIGRAYSKEDIGDAFDILGKTKNMYFDFTANLCDDAIRACIEAVGAKRLVFGSDLPIATMRMYRITENGEYFNVVPRGLYGDVSKEPHMRETDETVAPKIVVADTDIIKEAPIYLARSGFGDMIGKYIALTDWKISNILTGEHYCDKIADMTFEATEAVVKVVEGIANRDEKAYESLMYGLLLSGLAMQMMGNSRPASGAEHHISHLIEMQPKGLGVHSEALHGEKVGVGTLISLGEYWKLSELENIKFKDYETYDHTFLAAMYETEMLSEILEENKKDAAFGIQAKQMEKWWPDICNVLKQLPQPDVVEVMYESLGVKAKLSDIDVPDDLTEMLKKYSPTVRNRLTLMRLRKCFISE